MNLVLAGIWCMCNIGSPAAQAEQACWEENPTSKNRKFFMPKAMMNSTSTAVMMTPAYRGMFKQEVEGNG